MRRIHLLAMLVTLGGAGMLSPAPAGASDFEHIKAAMAKYCCTTYWGYGDFCCGDNGCRITSGGCSRW